MGKNNKNRYDNIPSGCLWTVLRAYRVNLEKLNTNELPCDKIPPPELSIPCKGPVLSGVVNVVIVSVCTSARILTFSKRQNNKKTKKQNKKQQKKKKKRKREREG
jgi:uncharacterized protein YqhQ